MTNYYSFLLLSTLNRAFWFCAANGDLNIVSEATNTVPKTPINVEGIHYSNRAGITNIELCFFLDHS